MTEDKLKEAFEKQKITLGPWTLRLTDNKDDITHSISESTYPYKNGGDLEDMGVNPEEFHFSCIIVNDDYDNNFDGLRKWFLSQFMAPVELTHPKHGVLKGYPGNVSFNHDRRLRCATFEFDFKIAGVQEDIQSYKDPYYECALDAQEVNAEVQKAIAEEMQKAGVPDVEGDDWSLAELWGSIGDAARAFARAVNSAMGQILGVIAQVQAPFDAISSTIDYLDSLSGTLTGALQGLCDSMTALSRKVDSKKSNASASILVENLQVQLEKMASSVPYAVYASFATLAASTLVTETAKHISDDEKQMEESIAAERVVNDDAEGRSIVEASEPYIMTPVDIENSVATVRDFINKVLPISVCPDIIKRQAAALTEAVLRLKVQYMTTKTVVYHQATPIHKIALDNGLNYKAADRLCALNNIKNPTFVKGEVLVYES